MSEPSLRDVQRWLRGKIRPASSPSVMSEAPSILLRPQRGVPGAEHLSIYATGWLVRTREALAEAYEAIHHLLGARAFEALAHAYARQHPSHHYNLSEVGREFADFLATAEITQQFPFLPDLARLEWRVREAFHAMEQPPWEVRTLSSMSLDAWDRTRFRFQPSVAVVSAEWPIWDLWQARAQAIEAITIELVNRPQHVVVHRQGYAVTCELMEPPAARLLRGLLDGQSLGVACAHLMGDATEGTSLPVAPWFAHWSQLGLITGCGLVERVAV